MLLTVGRMDARERYKGQDRVIGSLPLLVAAGHDAVYVLLGDGDDVARLKDWPSRRTLRIACASWARFTERP